MRIRLTQSKGCIVSVEVVQSLQGQSIVEMSRKHERVRAERMT